MVEKLNKIICACIYLHESTSLQHTGTRYHTLLTTTISGTLTARKIYLTEGKGRKIEYYFHWHFIIFASILSCLLVLFPQVERGRT